MAAFDPGAGVPGFKSLFVAVFPDLAALDAKPVSLKKYIFVFRNLKSLLRAVGSGFTVTNCFAFSAARSIPAERSRTAISLKTKTIHATKTVAAQHVNPST
jgi:hypothetical protein